MSVHISDNFHETPECGYRQVLLIEGEASPGSQQQMAIAWISLRSHAASLPSAPTGRVTVLKPIKFIC
jgi:hypothetical protein